MEAYGVVGAFRAFACLMLALHVLAFLARCWLLALLIEAAAPLTGGVGSSSSSSNSVPEPGAAGVQQPNESSQPEATCSPRSGYRDT